MPHKMSRLTQKCERTHSNLGRVLHYQGNYLQAETLYQEGLVLARASELHELLNLLLIYLGGRLPATGRQPPGAELLPGRASPGPFTGASRAPGGPAQRYGDNGI